MTASLTRTAATVPPREQMTDRTAFWGVLTVHENPQSGTITHSESVWVSSKERADCPTAGGINLLSGHGTVCTAPDVMCSVRTARRHLHPLSVKSRTGKTSAPATPDLIRRQVCKKTCLCPFTPIDL